MKLYLAGASRELDRVLPIVAELDKAGVTFSYRWWEAVQKHGVGTDHELTREQRRHYARTDLDGIADADVLWLLLPNGPSAGAFIELGYALGLREREDLKLVVSGYGCAGCIFAAFADWEGGSDVQAMHVVKTLLHAREQEVAT